MLPALPGKVELTGAIFPANLPFEKWAGLGAQLKQSRESLRWWIGDWLAYGEATYGERYAQALDNSEWDYQTLRNLVWVARAIPHADRRASLSWSHHAECAGLENDQRNALLDKTEAERLSVKDLRTLVHENDSHKPRKPRGINIGKYMIFENNDGVYLSNEDGEVMEVNESDMEEQLKRFWFTHQE